MLLAATFPEQCKLVVNFVGRFVLGRHLSIPVMVRDSIPRWTQKSYVHKNAEPAPRYCFRNASLCKIRWCEKPGTQLAELCVSDQASGTSRVYGRAIPASANLITLPPDLDEPLDTADVEDF